MEVGLDEQSNAAAIAIAAAHPEVFAAVGRHPNAAAGFDDDRAAAIEALAAHPKVRAIGETGLDLYRDAAPVEAQRRAFAAQVEIAARLALPVVIHVRDGAGPGEGAAVAEVFETLRRSAGSPVILHCFSATPARALEAAEFGWYCSFAGNVTYPSAETLRTAAALVPDHLILVETDSPYLAPVPHRGKNNEPANVTLTAATVASARGIGIDQLEALVDENAARLFGW